MATRRFTRTSSTNDGLIIPEIFAQLGSYIRTKCKEHNLNQADIARAFHVSESTVSQWIKGIQRPAPPKMGMLAAYLELDFEYVTEFAQYNEDEFDRFERAYHQALYEWKSAHWDTEDAKHQLTNSKNLFWVKPQFLLDTCTFWIPTLENNLRAIKSNGGKEAKRSQKRVALTLGEFYLARMLAESGLLPPDKIVESSLITFRYLNHMSELFGDDATQMSARAKYFLADAYYTGRKFNPQALMHARQNLTEAEQYSPLFELHPTAIRTRILICAYSGDRQAFLTVEKLARNYLENGTIAGYENTHTILEALGRAHALLGLPDMQAYFDRTEAQYHDMVNQTALGKPLLLVQHLRSRAEALLKNPPVDFDYVQSLLKRGIDLAEKHGYHRHRIELLRLQKSFIVL